MYFYTCLNSKNSVSPCIMSLFQQSFQILIFFLLVFNFVNIFLLRLTTRFMTRLFIDFYAFKKGCPMLRNKQGHKPYNLRLKFSLLFIFDKNKNGVSKVKLNIVRKTHQFQIGNSIWSH